MKFYIDGRAIRESTRTDDKEAAKRFLRTKEGAAATGAPITGHRTRSVVDRYHIVSPADLQAATRRLAEADGHVSGHVRATALDGRPVTTENA